MLDLDKARKERAARRAAVAGREATGEGLPVIFGSREIAVLPAELPFAALSPLQQINDEIALLLGQAVRMQQGGRAIEGTQLILDLLAANSNLPVTLVKVVKEIAAGILGDAGLAAFLDANPTVQDVVALAGGIFDFYGASLGESSRSAASSASDGPNFERTSNATTGSTLADSSELPALPGSSG